MTGNSNILGHESGKNNDTEYQPRVLIVDDEPRNVKLLAAMLSRRKFHILTAYNGQEALDVTKKHMPDLILLDIMMPILNGYEVIEKLKSDVLTQHIPIILITALDSPESKHKGLAIGAEEFLNKPVNTAELLARINSMLRLKQYKEQLTIRKKSQESFSTKKAPAQIPIASQNLHTILLVEDNPSDVKLIKAHLTGQNYRLLVADRGESAIKLAQSEKIDLLILDVMLPDTDGFQVCRQLKEMNVTRNIPIIFSTSLRDLDSRIKGIDAEGDDFLVKPINGKELNAKITHFLRKKKHLDELRSHCENTINSALNDALTGLYNHLHFKRSLELEVKRSCRQSHDLALLMIDLDNFKKYNDNLGHPAGDMILREVGRVIRENVRDIDLAARYGGEEFAVILPYTQTADALAIAERIRIAVSCLTLPLKSPPKLGHITVSIGIATYPANASSSDELITKADEMLYQAKRTGKNRVCLCNNYKEEFVSQC